MSTNVWPASGFGCGQAGSEYLCKTSYVFWNRTSFHDREYHVVPARSQRVFENSPRARRINLCPGVTLQANLQKLLNDFRVPEVVVIGNPRRIWLLRWLTSFWLTRTKYRRPPMKRTVRITSRFW